MTLPSALRAALPIIWIKERSLLKKPSLSASNIQIVDTSQWLKMGVKPKNYWLAQDKKLGDWLAKDNLYQIIK